VLLLFEEKEERKRFDEKWKDFIASDPDNTKAYRKKGNNGVHPTGRCEILNILYIIREICVIRGSKTLTFFVFFVDSCQWFWGFLCLRKK
jgi:hypothetical protein